MITKEQLEKERESSRAMFSLRKNAALIDKIEAMAAEIYIKEYLHWSQVVSVNDENDKGFSMAEVAEHACELAYDFYETSQKVIKELVVD